MSPTQASASRVQPSTTLESNRSFDKPNQPGASKAHQSNTTTSGHSEQRRWLLDPSLPWISSTQSHSILIFFAIWGLLTRLGLNAIGNFDGQSVFSLLLVQVVGCLIIGASVKLKDRLDKIHPLFYLGITTGYCGSVTTFSSWMLQVFQAFSNNSGYSRGGFRDLLDGVNQTYVTVALCFFAIQTGFHLGSLVARNFSDAPPHPADPKLSSSRAEGTSKTFMTILIALAGPATWLGSVFLFFYGPHRWRGSVTYSMIISPIGTLLRFYLAKLNQSNFANKYGFPIGTFLSNMIATGFLGILTSLQYMSVTQGKPELCGSLQGLKDGFCGCLSTISTFFLELHKSGPGFRSFRYAFISWVLGQVLCVLLLGIYTWTHDRGERCRFPN